MGIRNFEETRQRGKEPRILGDNRYLVREENVEYIGLGSSNVFMSHPPKLQESTRTTIEGQGRFILRIYKV